MKRPRPLLLLLQLRTFHFSRASCRTYATGYSGGVVPHRSDARTIAIEVESPTLARYVRGYALPRHDLVCRVLKILHSSYSDNPFLDLSHYLQTLTLTLTTSEVSEILKSLRNPHNALDFFHYSATSIPGFRHDYFTYNSILTILARSVSPLPFNVVNQIIDEMERDGVCGSISTVNILLGIFGTEGEIQRCLDLAKKWDLRFNSCTYKCLLQAYLRSNEVVKAFGVFEDMKRRGYKLDIFAYNMLLDLLGKDEQVDQAYKVFADMKHRHCEPDEYTYTILIRMTGKMGETDDFISLFHEMILKGCIHNFRAYNTMIEALAKNRMVDKAIFLFSKMVENNFRPNKFTFSVILDVLAAEGQIGRLFEVVEISKKYINKSLYAYLVETLCKLGHASEALDLLSKIHEKGLSTGTFMYNMVFSALGKLKQLSHIRNLYEKMKQDGPMPDIFTYTILISSFGKAGRVDEALNLFEEMEANHCRPNTITYNSLIDCLGKNGDLDEAHMRFKEMQEKGLKPDVVTYSTLIECFGKLSNVEMASQLFDEMLAEGCYPNIVTYNILLDCLEKCGKTADALKLYEKLKQQGLTPDSITYAMLERLQSGSHSAVRVRKPSPITGCVVSPLS